MTRTVICSVLTIAVAAAAGAFAPAARADVIYKSIGPDGDTSYASRPAPGARESTAIDIPSMSPEQRRASQLLRRQDKALSDEVNARLRSLESEWRRVDLEITSAQKGLASAENALRSGRTPLPGERLGKAGGGSRLSEAYFLRLRAAETRVEEAKQRLDKAYAARNNLR
jgi:hypothetical protein